MLLVPCLPEGVWGGVASEPSNAAVDLALGQDPDAGHVGSVRQNGVTWPPDQRSARISEGWAAERAPVLRSPFVPICGGQPG